MKSAYDLADPDDARRFLNDDPAGEYRWQPPGSEPIYVDQLASLLQFTEPRPDSHTLTGDEALPGSRCWQRCGTGWPTLSPT
ncbi:hypothetical protein ACFQX6_13135 [Streptosporangium lutulentum]